MKGMGVLFLVLLMSTMVAGLWNSVPIIKSTVHAVFDPTLGNLLDIHLQIGFVILSALISFFITLVYKYTTDQEMLKEIKKEQKIVQAQMKEFRDNPQKLLELQKKSMELIGKSLPITMRPSLYTIVPIILLFRWFGDYFISQPGHIFGMSWFVAYLVFAIVFTSLFRSLLKVH